MGKILDYLPHKLMQDSSFRAVVEWQIAVIEAYAKYIVFIERKIKSIIRMQSIFIDK